MCRGSVGKLNLSAYGSTHLLSAGMGAKGKGSRILTTLWLQFEARRKGGWKLELESRFERPWG